MSNAGVEDSAPVPFRARLKKNWWRLALISATFEGEREGGSGGYSRRLDATGDRAPERMRDHLTSRGFTPQGKDSTLMCRSDGVVLTYTVCAVVGASRRPQRGCPGGFSSGSQETEARPLRTSSEGRMAESVRFG